MSNDSAENINIFEAKLKELMEASTKVATFDLDESGAYDHENLENIYGQFDLPIRIHHEEEDNLFHDLCVVDQLQDIDPLDYSCQIQNLPESEEPQVFQRQIQRKTEISTASMDCPTKEETKLILKERKMSKQTTKNTNFPKFLVRLFQKYGGPSNSLHKGNPENLKQLNRILKEFKERSTNHFNMNDIEALFGPQDEGEDFCSLNRRKMMHTFRRKLNSEVNKNNYVRNKISYMVAGKVFALRLRNCQLATRIQSR